MKSLLAYGVIMVTDARKRVCFDPYLLYHRQELETERAGFESNISTEIRHGDGVQKSTTSASKNTSRYGTWGPLTARGA